MDAIGGSGFNQRVPPVTTIASPMLGAALTLAVLGAEARRLPLQNVVALALVSMASATGIEGCATLGRAFDLPSMMAAVPLTTASLLAARAIARLPGPGPQHLFARTLLAAVVLAGLAHWPGTQSPFQAAAVRISGIPPALLLLAPWWINKRLAPAQTPGWAGLAAPALLLGLATLALLDGNPATASAQAFVGSALAFLTLRGLKPSGTPSSGGHSPKAPDPPSGS